MGQYWSINPPKLQYSFVLNGALPAAQTVNIGIKDFIGTPAGLGYENFHMVVERTPNWLSNNLAIPYSIIANNQNQDIDFTLVEAICNGLQPDSYFDKVKLGVYGTNIAFGVEQLISEIEVFVQLIVAGANSISVTPSITNFEHILNAAIPNAEVLIVTGNNWKILTPIGFILSSADAAVTITQLLSGAYTAEGDGTKNINIAVSATLLNEVSETNYVGSLISTVNLLDELIDNFTITVRVSSDNVFEFSPSKLSFFGIKNAEEPAAQELIIDSDLAFTINKPDWLLVTPALGQNHVVISVVPEPTANTTPDLYSGFLEISRIIDGNVVLTKVPILYELIEFVSLPDLKQNFWFSLDNKFLEVFTETLNTYFQLELSATLYDFSNAVEKTIILPYKIPLFKKHQQFNIGRIVDRLMYRMNSYNDATSAQYKPANITCLIEEKKIEDNSIIRSVLISNIKYVAGVIPETIIENCCFLDVNPKDTRVTVNSFYFLNYLLATGNYILKVEKNGDEFATINVNAALDNVFTRKITFELFDPGDIIKYSIDINGELLEKTFVVFPNNKESYHIVWEDEHKLKSALEFTGDYRMATDHKGVYQNYYKNLVEFLEKINSTRDKKFTANTGFILKRDQLRIDSLLDSKKAWLVLADGTTINLVALDKKITDFDSERTLYEYDIIFQINKAHHAQSYSF